MKNYPRSLLVTITLIVTPYLAANTANATDHDKDIRYFMFIGEPNADAWKFLIENPQDRKTEVTGAFKALGGEVLSYYFGLGDGKNYITVTIPNDNELIQAIYLMRLPSGLLQSYQVIELIQATYVTRLGDDLLVNYGAIELMTSADMVKALKRIADVKAVDDR